MVGQMELDQAVAVDLVAQEMVMETKMRLVATAQQTQDQVVVAQGETAAQIIALLEVLVVLAVLGIQQLAQQMAQTLLH